MSHAQITRQPLVKTLEWTLSRTPQPQQRDGCRIVNIKANHRHKTLRIRGMQFKSGRQQAQADVWICSSFVFLRLSHVVVIEDARCAAKGMRAWKFVCVQEQTWHRRFVRQKIWYFLFYCFTDRDLWNDINRKPLSMTPIRLSSQPKTKKQFSWLFQMHARVEVKNWLLQVIARHVMLLLGIKTQDLPTSHTKH